MALPTTSEIPFPVVTIPIVSRPFVVPSTMPAGTPPVYPLLVGRSFQQHMAGDDAMGWFAYAAEMLTDSEIARVNTLSPQAQFEYVDDVTTAIERAVNNLNIFIWSDPIARATYRKWLSGPPASPASIFDPRLNWGGSRGGGSGFGSGFEIGWFVPNSNLPVIDDGGTTGLIPRNAREKFRAAIRNVTNPNQFVPTVGFDLSTVHGEAPRDGSDEITRELLVALQPNVINRHWVTQGALGSECFAGFAYPRICQYVPGRVVGVGGFSSPNTRVQGEAWNRWDTFFAQAPAFGYGGTLICAEGPSAYLPFLRELVAGFLSRTPAEIVQDTRAFITYQNAEGVRANGGPAAFLAAATGASGDVLTQMIQTNAAAQAYSTATVSVGTALVGMGGYTAVAGLIVMAVGYFAGLADRLIAKDVVGHGKDDIGRFKPVLERFVLSGDATATPPLPPGFPAYQAPAGTVIPAPSTSISGFEDLNALVAGMRISCSAYLALDRATRFERVGVAAFQGGRGPYVPPTDPAQASLLSRLVDALNAHCVRAGILAVRERLVRELSDSSRFSNNTAPPSEASIFWGRLGVGVALAWSAWKILMGSSKPDGSAGVSR